MILGRSCAFAGASGVGKSTLLNTLFPSLQLITGQISKKILRGKNTTRQSVFFNVSQEVGAENIIEHTVDLASDEGSKKYGSVQDKVSLLTCELFRKYHDILEKYNPGRWWWLATPIAVEGWEDCVRAVSDFGMLLYYYCYYDDGGVRPFYILNSSISVS